MGLEAVAVAGMPCFFLWCVLRAAGFLYICMYIYFVPPLLEHEHGRRYVCIRHPGLIYLSTIQYILYWMAAGVVVMMLK